MNSEDWNRKYAEKELVWSATPNRFLVAEAAGLEPGRALDVACGEGRNAIWLAEQGWRVTGVDFSEVAVEKGRRIAERRGVGSIGSTEPRRERRAGSAGASRGSVDWRVEDVLAYEPEPGAYDLVILFYLQLVQEELRPVLARAARAVAPGGTFLLVAHDTRNLTEGFGGPKDPAVLYTPEDVVPSLGGLEVEKAEAVLRPVEEENATAVDCLVRARRAALPR